ncbi:MAG: hypothetical protein KBF57_00360 [Saprospiraceae bacterium]|jgi:hypothetical protein|nr:hypothetical protein [Saprospiraceae bacterium]MBP9193102.1 hypothetical protein [Saprospiraceae bacterium]
MVGKYIIMAFLAIHGLIHFMGFIKALQPDRLTALPDLISMPKGLLWLLCMLVLGLAFILLFVGNENWWVAALIGVCISSWLIYDYGEAARYGWIANAALMIAIVIGWSHSHYAQAYRWDVKKALEQKKSKLATRPLEELPLPVQKYLSYCGSNTDRRPTHVFFTMNGKMQDSKGSWFDFTSEQYDFFEPYSRSFLMYGKIKGLNVPGYHKWTEGKGSMDVRVFGLIPILHYEGQMMDQSDAVTLLNDICLMVPSALLDPNFRWENIDSFTTKIYFPYPGGEVSADLIFNEEGKLINFISDDRYDVGRGKKFRFSTPVTAYTKINDTNVVKSADAIWHYPEGDFTYAKFNLAVIEIKF